MTKLATLLLLTLRISYGSGKHFLIETLADDDDDGQSNEESSNILLSNDDLGNSQALIFSEEAGEDYMDDDDETEGGPVRRNDYCNAAYDVGCDDRTCTTCG